jgi:hypothetical protein
VFSCLQIGTDKRGSVHKKEYSRVISASLTLGSFQGCRHPGAARPASDKVPVVVCNPRAGVYRILTGKQPRNQPRQEALRPTALHIARARSNTNSKNETCTKNRAASGAGRRRGGYRLFPVVGMRGVFTPRYRLRLTTNSETDCRRVAQGARNTPNGYGPRSCRCRTAGRQGQCACASRRVRAERRRNAIAQAGR